MNSYHHHRHNYNESSSDESSVTTMGDEASVDLLQQQCQTPKSPDNNPATTTIYKDVNGTGSTTRSPVVESLESVSQKDLTSKDNKSQSLHSIISESISNESVPSSLVSSTSTNEPFCLKKSLVQCSDEGSEDINDCHEALSLISKEKSDDVPLSPATRTLNELSQIEATDGADLIYDMSQHHNRTTRVKESRTDSQLNNDDANLPKKQFMFNRNNIHYYIGLFTEPELNIVKPKVKALFNKWQSQGLNLSKEEVKEELRRRGIRTSYDRRNQSDVFKKSSNVNPKEGNDSDDSLSPVTRTLNKSSQFEAIDGAVMENDVSQHRSRMVKESRTDSQLNNDDSSLPKKQFRFRWNDKIYYIGLFTEPELNIMKPKITALFNKWQSQGLNLSKEEVKEELQRRGMKSMRAFGRWIQPDVFKKSSNVISKEGNDSDDSVLPVTRTLNKSSQIETSGCDRSRSIVNNTRQETVTLKRKRPWEDNVIRNNVSINGSIFIMALTEEGPFGIKIKVKPSFETCCIAQIEEGGQADNAGLQVNDFIYSVPTEEIQAKGDFYKHLKVVSVEQVSEWAASTKRPIVFAIKRYEGEPSIASRDNACNILASGNFPHAPFCKKCNSSTGSNSASYHHTLCPRHHEFGHSGAKDKMIILLAGLRVGCMACSFHLANGKKCPILKHNEKCINLIEKKEKTTRYGRNEVKKGQEHHQRPKRKKKKRRIKTTSEKDTVPFRSKPISSSPEFTSHSIEGLTLNSSSNHIQNTQSVSDYREKKEVNHMLRNEVTDCYNISSSRPQNSKPSKVSPINCSDMIVSPETNEQDRSHNIDISNYHILTDDTSVAKWVSCPNPWGDHSHREGDFVLMSPFDYKVAYESIRNASKRFVHDPFANNSSYYQSHIAPENGYQVLQLTRDSLALRSWGFSFKYHDFGGACFISKVEPSSPAGSAVFVGQNQNQNFHPLRPQDILICVNGKKVGGMTDVELEVELDVAGAEILLTVARCKFPRSIDKTYCGQGVWEHMCSRGIYWNEIGKPQPANESLDATGNSNDLVQYSESKKRNIIADSDKIFDGLDNPRFIHELDKSIHAKSEDSMKDKRIEGRRGESTSLVNRGHIDTIHTPDLQMTKNSDTIDTTELFKRPQNEEVVCIDESDKAQYNKKDEIELEEESSFSSIESQEIDDSGDISSDCEHTKGKDDTFEFAVAEEEDHEKETCEKRYSLAERRKPNCKIQQKEESYGEETNTSSSVSRLDCEESDDCMMDSESYESNESPAANGVEKMVESSSNEKCIEWSDDENPWLGCICGQIHEPPIKVFWIQCDCCDSWFSCNSDCLGFNQKEANTMKKWECPSCDTSR